MVTPRRRSTRRYSGRGQRSQQAQAAGSAYTSRASSTGRRRQQRGLSRADLESLSRAAAEKLYGELGLEALGIPRDVAIPVLEEIASSIAEQYTSKPSADAIAKRALAQRESVYKAIAAKLAEKGESLTASELEFIVQYAPEIAGRAAPLLWQAAVKENAGHVVSALRDLWSLHGSPTKAVCPRCGFKALTPDYTCIVCGASVSENEFKEKSIFGELLEHWAKKAPIELVEEAIRAGYVYYEDDEIKAPSQPGDVLRLQVFLSKREKEFLKTILKARSAGATGESAKPKSYSSSSQPQASPHSTS